MIYFDNAATTKIKPKAVYDSFMYYAQEIGTSPGRGSYSLGIQASRMLFQCRKTVGTYFGCPQKANVIFTKNSTEAINLFLTASIKQGDHILISCFEHNAVLRPIHTLFEKGIITYTVLPESVFDNPEDELSQYILPNTKIAAITLASNLTGQLVYSSQFGAVCKKHGITVFVDASQGGGKGIVNMARDNIDHLAFTGHKDLFALPGVGGLCSASPLDGAPLIQGGTGIHGETYVNPAIYPETYESGTLNMPAIWALKAAIDDLKVHQNEYAAEEAELLSYFVNGLKALDNVLIYKEDKKRVPTICFNIKNYSSSNVVMLLSKEEICVRGGIHCAILAHEALGTVDTGAVRASINHNNTRQEIDYFLKILGGIK